MPSEPTQTPPVHTPRRWLRWLKHLLVTLHFLLFVTVLLASAALYVVFRPDGLALVNTYLLRPMGIHYAKAEGSLIEGFTLYDVRTGTTFAEQLTLDYNMTRILQGEHVVEKITLRGLRLDLEDFISDDESPWPFPTFQLKAISITNLQLISTYPIELDIEAHDGVYDGDALSLESLRATLKSRYAGAAIRGSVRNNTIRGEALLYPNHRELSSYGGRFTELPRTVAVQIRELSDTRALLRGNIDRLALKQDPSLEAKGIVLDFDYRYENNHLDVDAAYVLERGGESMRTRQHLRYAFEGKTTTEFDGNITSRHPLPATELHGEITDNPEGLSGRLTIDGGTLLFSSDDYDRFRWDLDARHDTLSFLPMLPTPLQASPFTLAARGEYRLSQAQASGSVTLMHNHGTFEGKFTYGENLHFLEGNLSLSPDAPTWKGWSHKPPEKLTLRLNGEGGSDALHLYGEGFEFSLKNEGKALVGEGNYAGAYFDIKGVLNPGKYEAWINAHTPSLFATALALRPITLHKGEYYDAEIHSQTHLIFDEKLRFHTDVQIPWYAAVLDSQRSFGGTKGELSLDYDEGNITVDRYRFEIADHPVSSLKSSRLRLLPGGEVAVDEVWIYDTLLLQGSVSSDTSASLRLTSDRFSYRGPEGEAHASADITFTRDRDANQNLFGTFTLQDAKITYLPLQQFKVMDEDIIIVQDVRPPSALKLAMNLHITAVNPIHYQTKELDVLLDPDITLWRDPQGPMQILGMITFPSGSASTSGKQFDVKHSEIYFGGDVPLNPYLNLTIGHEVDYKKILIYVTHTLDSPIFLFSSDPIMSQNDIMSYILFGTPANTSTKGDNSTSTIRADATNFMLGAGLKGLINGATKLQIDTMNILTTQQGGMGFEVGARLNKNLRVLYKNDTLSSVLIQYTVNRWLRLDADIHELGQGINAVYIKDFKDFLPHNEPKKKQKD